jgi:L-amino acid N-acyltransferase YncA
MATAARIIEAEPITAQAESFSAARPELERLFPLHWKELALEQDKIPLDVDWPRYAQLERAGILLFVTLRKAGRLVGYFMGFVMPHLHYKSTVTLGMDVYWTHPDIRGGTAARRLMRKVHEEAKVRGAVKAFAVSKDHKDSSRLFRALGYRPVETVHTKWIGE